jgi:hypothetical protein
MSIAHLRTQLIPRKGTLLIGLCAEGDVGGEVYTISHFLGGGHPPLHIKKALASKWYYFGVSCG